MIREREVFFTQKLLSNQEFYKKHFPRYIMMRRPKESSQDEEYEWQGFIKEIKKTIHKVNEKIEKHLKKFHDDQEQNKSELNSQLKEMKD